MRMGPQYAITRRGLPLTGLAAAIAANAAPEGAEQLSLLKTTVARIVAASAQVACQHPL